MSTSAGCVVCQQPLIFAVEDEVEGDEEKGMGSGVGSSEAVPAVVPDDVELRCGCHYHWSCALERLKPSPDGTVRCPFCNVPYITLAGPQGTQLLCTVRNEGGVEAGYDLFPDIIEDGYLDAHPQARKALAFHDLCTAGDVDGIADLLDEDEAGSDEQEQDGVAIDVLSFQNPLQNGRSALHVAIWHQQPAVVWLLLWLASGVPEQAFPAELLVEARRRGLARERDAPGGETQMVDIRGLRDGDGRTGLALARDAGMHAFADVLAP